VELPFIASFLYTSVAAASCLLLHLGVLYTSVAAASCLLLHLVFCEYIFCLICNVYKLQVVMTVTVEGLK